MRITHPRPDYGRQKFIGVQFVDGIAEVDELDPEVEASLLQHGFTIEKEPVADPTPGKLTKSQQKALAETQVSATEAAASLTAAFADQE